MVGKMKNVNSRAAWYLQACRYDTSYHRIPWYIFFKNYLLQDGKKVALQLCTFFCPGKMRERKIESTSSIRSCFFSFFGRTYRCRECHHRQYHDLRHLHQGHHRHRHLCRGSRGYHHCHHQCHLLYKKAVTSTVISTPNKRVNTYLFY